MIATSKSVTFDERIELLEKEIQDLYAELKRPWVIGFSGGKDSSTALQLIWYALRNFNRDELEYPVYVISSDTLVESPPIAREIHSSISKMNAVACAEGLPISAHVVTPNITDSFWVKLIGRGYPAPSTAFRWCTSRLKIKPADAFIKDKISEHGEVILVLGVRIGESTTRDQVMKLHQIKGSNLSRHSTFAAARVYTPIRDFTVRDVWYYLLDNDSPWGDNIKLYNLYKTSMSGECPLVIDKHTPSCGGSRFGCWTCTVVKEDKTTVELIKEGQTELQPLLDFRNKLKKSVKQVNYKLLDKTLIKEYCDSTDNEFKIREDKLKWITSHYKQEYRERLLSELENIQQQVGMNLVSEDEKKIIYTYFNGSCELDFLENKAHLFVNTLSEVVATPRDYLLFMTNQRRSVGNLRAIYALGEKDYQLYQKSNNVRYRFTHHSARYVAKEHLTNYLEDHVKLFKRATREKKDDFVSNLTREEEELLKQKFTSIQEFYTLANDPSLDRLQENKTEKGLMKYFENLLGGALN